MRHNTKGMITHLLVVLTALTTAIPSSGKESAGAPEPSVENRPPEIIIVEVFQEAGATRHESAQALAVAWHESDWRPEARNRTCCATGLFQITLGTWKRYEKTCAHGGSGTGCATDPEMNSLVASRIWQGDKEAGHYQGWGQWSVANEKVEPGRQARRGILDDPLASIKRDGQAGSEAFERAEQALCSVYCPPLTEDEIRRYARAVYEQPVSGRRFLIAEYRHLPRLLEFLHIGGPPG